MKFHSMRQLYKRPGSLPAPARICLFLTLLFLNLANPLPGTLAKQHQESELNPIQVENQLPGTTKWQLSKPAPYDKKTFHYPQIEGYAWSTSAEAGEEVQFSVSTLAPSFRVDVYRLGWYQGKGGRFITSIRTVPGHAYTFSPPDPQTGLVNANWPVAFTLTPAINWVTGLYLVKLTSSRGYQSYIPLVIRSSRKSDFAFIHAVNTDEAYNTWGGTSLYDDLTGSLRWQRAFKVSFDRPFQQNVGAGQILWWEYPMVRWLERNGYDVSYFSDVDIQDNANALQNYHALLIVGHSEYWSEQMYDRVEAAVNNGVNLAVFAANTFYWQIRYELHNSAVTALPERILVCYKDWTRDPLYGKDNQAVTVQFRQFPLNKPEQEILGSMYASYWPTDQGAFPWVVTDASSWVFTGTGLKDGDSLKGLVGYEYDRVFSEFPKPAGLTILSASPVVDVNKLHDIANATIYTAPGGAQVFNAATIEWSWGLDSYESANPGLVNKAAQRITANILQKFRIAGSKVQATSSSGSELQITLLIGLLSLFVALLTLYLLFRLYRGYFNKKTTKSASFFQQGREAGEQRKFP